MTTKNLIGEHHLPLLGTRKYLHGTTLLDHLLQGAPTGIPLSFSIRRRIDGDHIRVRPWSRELARQANASLVWQEKGGRAGLLVSALEPTDAPMRLAWDEAQVTDQLDFGGDGHAVANLSGGSPFSFVATAVPIFKALLSREISEPGPGQWYFTRYDGTVPDRFGNMQLSLVAAIPGRIAEAAIRVDGRDEGRLWFSRAP